MNYGMEVNDSKILNKKTLFNNAKKEIKRIYNKLKTKSLDVLNLYLFLDTKKNKYFRILLLLSLYCTYYHDIKNKINIKKLPKTLIPNLINECYKKNNFVILKLSKSHVKIMEDLAIYFNTDANNIEPLSGIILNDLNKINIILKQNK